MKKSIFFIVFMIIPYLIFGETIYLLDGSKINGEIVESNKTVIKIKTSYGIIEIPKKNIDHISYNEEEIIEDKDEKNVNKDNFEEKKTISPIKGKKTSRSITSGYYHPYSDVGGVFLGISIITTAIGLGASLVIQKKYEEAEGIYTEYKNTKNPDEASKLWGKYEEELNQCNTGIKIINGVLYYGAIPCAILSFILFAYKKEKNEAYYFSAEIDKNRYSLNIRF